MADANVGGNVADELGQGHRPRHLVESVHLTGRHPVHGVVLPLAPFTVIVGRNDSGKSTLLDCVEAVLSDDVPETGRPGWWSPSAEGAAFLRSRIDLPDGELRVLGPQAGHSFVVEVDGAGVEVDVPLALELMRPAGEVVRLDTSRSVRDAGDAGLDFLAAVVEDSLGDGWMSGGDPDNPADLRHLLDPSRGIAAWVQEALDTLARTAFSLMPASLTADYERLDLLVVDDPASTLQIDMILVDDHGGCPFEQLATGLQSWVHLALREAARRLTEAHTVIDGDVLRVTDVGPTATLYVVDEPERHLHPTAATAVAHWLHSLTADASRQVSVLVATHSPAFLGLHRHDDVTLVQCRRVDLPDDDYSHSVTTVNRWTPPQVRGIAQHAAAIGMDLPDVFFTGTLPVLVEGRFDLEYFQRIWPLVCGTEAEAFGIRFFTAGGVPSAPDVLAQIVTPVYGSDAPVVLITDNPALDYPATKRSLDVLEHDFPQLRVVSHGAFDIWAMIPESALDRHRVRRGDTTWRTLEERRRRTIKESATSKRMPALAGKDVVLTQDAKDAWPRILDGLTRFDIPKRARAVVTQVNAIARRRHV